MTQQKSSRKANGHPGPNGRLNGHGPAYAPARPAGREGGGAPEPACSDRLWGQAASDDAGRQPDALAAPSGATNLQTQADTGCQAYAAAAPPLPNETAPARGSQAEGQKRTGKSACATDEKLAGDAKDELDEELPEGKYPLPDNPAEFVEEIHRKVDLTEVWHRLLRSKDVKIRQRAIEKLTGMLYKDGTLAGDDPQPFIFDLPRPKRD